ncbi:single-stranded-DNA-specific exonuclease RecJ [Psychrobacter sp. AOP22-C1-22]|uniref:single-stranded-DNA-specific exonuclease RecJ n=1 Tax=unclassified Psychrobacter TaxID=196806 RepID=UPI0017880456|nr:MULTISPECIES: single-stranded-DNA-specific exonuclease RecJ [unclassified Psychrobacter]MBE0405557.1 single-stranded-DNA-specific exonuclease RecJ [Psychrobacter sp. FME6]MBE0444540.1 single-stranded-DNA-specific exonuclease RecJ [Psychrobacter sp. FME5]MDN5801538.1 single-stranded-DNA-specific exonuclease RecJ [Psychrobacter sp.]
MLKLTSRYTSTRIDELPAALQPLAAQSLTLARLYAGRGIVQPDELETQLSGLLPAEMLQGVTEAVRLLDVAIDEGQRILIVGDFDCDGATSTALMMRALTAMGAVVDFLVPDRFKYGYGLTPEIVELGIETYRPDLIVTVDNGISSHEGVARAQADGITVIITDHHLTTKETPPAEAVVNPNQLGCHFTSKALVGVGVAFYVLGRLAKLRREASKSTVQVSQYLDLVALGTIADVGVLDKNNRILVHHGLAAIRQGRCSLGILALLEQAGRDPKQLHAQDFGFVLGPRINAAGRMDNMRIGIECLLTDDWPTAQRLAQELEQLNRTRRHVEGEMRTQADSIVQALATTNTDSDSDESSELIVQNKPEKKIIDDRNRSIVLYQDDWHQGVIGIVAGRLKESHYLPSIVFAPADTERTGDDDAIKGSARSIAGVHIRDAIEQVAEQHPDLISHFGGHAMAAGLTIKRRNFEGFVSAFNEVMAQMDDEVFAEQKFTDGALQASDFSLWFAEHLADASIWGHGFAPPIFDGVFEVLSFKILKDKHLKLSLRYPEVQYPIEAIQFNFDSNAWDYRAENVHILFELDINEWNGKQSLQLMVKDLAVITET